LCSFLYSYAHVASTKHPLLAQNDQNTTSRAVRAARARAHSGGLCPSPGGLSSVHHCEVHDMYMDMDMCYTVCLCLFASAASRTLLACRALVLIVKAVSGHIRRHVALMPVLMVHVMVHLLVGGFITCMILCIPQPAQMLADPHGRRLHVCDERGQVGKSRRRGAELVMDILIANVAVDGGGTDDYWAADLVPDLIPDLVPDLVPDLGVARDGRRFLADILLDSLGARPRQGGGEGGGRRGGGGGGGGDGTPGDGRRGR